MRVYLATFGCRANQYDTESVRAMLLAGGHEIVASPDSAQAAVFNSCAVTADAEADLRQGVRRAARANPALRSVVRMASSELGPTSSARLSWLSDSGCCAEARCSRARTPRSTAGTCSR